MLNSELLLFFYCVPLLHVVMGIHQNVWEIEIIVEEEDEEKTDESKKKRTEELALMLGLHIAREHPDGNVLIRYILQHMVKS